MNDNDTGHQKPTYFYITLVDIYMKVKMRKPCKGKVKPIQIHMRPTLKLQYS